MNNFQFTLAIIKPHAVKVPFALKNIRNVILSNGFYVLDTRKINMTKEEAKMFYKEHESKFFCNRLVTLMSSGPSHAHILARENAIQLWRDLMGPTKFYRTQFTHPESIRGKHGLSDTRNAVHGSDSVLSAIQEIEFFFPGFSTKDWLQRIEKISFENIRLNKDNFVHLIS